MNKRLEEIKTQLPDEVMKYVHAWEKEYNEPLNPKVAELVLAMNNRGVRTIMSWGDERISVLIETPFVLVKPLPENWGIVGWKSKIENSMLLTKLYESVDEAVTRDEAERIAGCFECKSQGIIDKIRSLFGITAI